MAMTNGIRESLVYAETSGKAVTVTAGAISVTGKVCSVSPLVIDPDEGGRGHLVNLDMITSVCVEGVNGSQLVAELRPKGEARFGARSM